MGLVLGGSTLDLVPSQESKSLRGKTRINLAEIIVAKAKLDTTPKANL